MLDVSKLLPQLDRLTATNAAENIKEALERAETLLQDASVNEEAFCSKLEANAATAFWPLPRSLESISKTYQVDKQTAPLSVAAVDGSQIAPSHHEVYNCYLLNIGKVGISYGGSNPVLLESTPHLFHAIEDLYPLIDKRRIHVDETFIALERGLMELANLRDLSLLMAERALPVVAFYDGSFVPWSIGNMPDAYQRAYFLRANDIHQSFLQHGIPLLGYISHSRAAEVINALRVWQCPYPSSRCSSYCGELCEEDFPCSSIWPLLDRQLFLGALAHGWRSTVFQSSNPKANFFAPEFRLAFTYLHVGNEVARVEMPFWLTQNEQQLNLALSATLTQAEKGLGYPICLAEAHNQALVTGADRTHFFELIQRSLAESGARNATISPKEHGKRHGLV